MRNSSFEFLRLLLMFLIVIHHCIVHGLGLKGISDAWDQEFLLVNNEAQIGFLLNSLCISAVNCFILISGYFGIKNPKEKLVNVIKILLFYTVFFAIIPAIADNNLKLVLRYSLLISHTSYWFIVDYIFLLIFVPLINSFYEHYHRKANTFTIVGQLIISCYFGFVWGNNANEDGYTILQFFMMYCIGRWIKINNISLNKSKSGLLYIIPSICCGIFSYILFTRGYLNYAWKLTYYNNPLVLISAIGLFLFFKNINFKSSVINNLAKSSLAIYLIQDSPYIGKKMYRVIHDLYMSTPPILYG